LPARRRALIGDRHARRARTIADESALALRTEPARHAIHDAFVATGGELRARAGDRVGEAFDGYRKRWVELATDVCQAERDAGSPCSALIVRRGACLTAVSMRCAAWSRRGPA
jgi:hypothetical protein